MTRPAWYPELRSRETRLALGLPLVLAGIALVVLLLGDLDVRLTDRFFDPAQGLWPYRKHWLASRLLHRHGQLLIELIAAGALALWLASFRVAGLRRQRRRLLFLVLAIVLSTAGAGFLKAISFSPCPWDSLRYGGAIAHLSLLEPPAAGAVRGQCLPGAHAAGGFSLMAFYYLFRERSRRRAWIALGLGFATGTVYGLAQVVRGAHYPSHNLWSCVIVWLVCSALFFVGFGGTLEARPSSA